MTRSYYLRTHLGKSKDMGAEPPLKTKHYLPDSQSFRNSEKNLGDKKLLPPRVMFLSVVFRSKGSVPQLVYIWKVMFLFPGTLSHWLAYVGLDQINLDN